MSPPRTPRVFVVLSRDARLCARLRTAWEPIHPVVTRGSWDEALAALRSRTVELLAVDTGPNTGERAEASLAWIGARIPDVATLAIVDPGDARRAFALGRAGTDGLVLAGATDQSKLLRHAADRALARALARRVVRSLPDRLDPLVSRSLARSIEWAGDVEQESALAESEGIGVASLRRRLRERSPLTPVRLIRWGRLFRAVHALGRDEETVERAAHRFGYSSGAALGRAIRRDIGVATTHLNDRGGLACALDAFLRFVDGPVSGR